MKTSVGFYCDKIYRFRPVVFLCLFYFALAVSRAEGENPPVILALGDSLTAGFGVPEQESYPTRLKYFLKEKGYPHVVINAGVSGDTTAGGLRRLTWLMKMKPKIVIIALGANDGLRGLPVEDIYSNLKQIIQLSREHHARVLLIGMKTPPNYGEKYSHQFEEVFTRLAKEYQVPFIPFLLEGVAAKRELTQSDGIHPLGAGYKIVADTVWKTLEPML